MDMQTSIPSRTADEQAAYLSGRECRRKGLSLRDSDFAVARKWGIHDNLLDASTDGWYDEDES